MRATDLTVLYLVVGVGASAAVLTRHHGDRAQRAIDAALVLAFWPLYGPFLLMTPVAGKPLAELAPTADVLGALAARITAAEHRLSEIDALLAKPDHSEERARARVAALVEQGDALGERLAGGRLAAIQRLVGVRTRFARQLEQARELMVQLRLQGELVKLAGDPHGNDRELLAELTLEVECLDEIVRTGLDAGLG